MPVFPDIRPSAARSVDTPLRPFAVKRIGVAPSHHRLGPGCPAASVLRPRFKSWLRLEPLHNFGQYGLCILQESKRMLNLCARWPWHVVRIDRTNRPSIISEGTQHHLHNLVYVPGYSRIQSKSREELRNLRSV